MTLIKFNSDFNILSERLFNWDQETIRAETQFIKCGWKFIFHNNINIPIITNFYSCLPEEFRSYKAIVDTKVTYLMKDMYPCIPGWHLDDVPRTRSDGQPEHINPIYKSRHCAAIVGDASLTQYLQRTIELEDLHIGEGIIYKKWDQDINNSINLNPHYYVYQVKPSLIIQFNWQTFHQGTPATHIGWRWFGRVTIDSNRQPRNEIRKQTQIYCKGDVSW